MIVETLYLPLRGMFGVQRPLSAISKYSPDTSAEPNL